MSNLKPNIEMLVFSAKLLEAKALISSDDLIAKLIADRKFGELAKRLSDACNLLDAATIQLHILQRNEVQKGSFHEIKRDC